MSVEIVDECYECMKYVKMVSDAEEWSCQLCKMKEIKIHLDTDIYVIWNRYELQCGHQVHDRCYRKWCKQTDSVGCPDCGKRSKKECYQYCESCMKFGHPHQSYHKLQ